MPLSPGDRLGPYEILSPLGAGGMGEVYKALDTRLDRTVAIKVLPKFIADRDDLRARFEREARAVASLKHPNICVLHDIGKQDGIDFIVLEHLEGETLAARVSKGPLPLDQVLKYATQIADALDRAHRSNVNHRDVKPANIIVTRDGIKVLDFGLAKTAPRVVGSDDVTRMPDALTSEGTMLGTPQYMAPEQYEGKEADARSDIFAFGCVVYEMVTGKRCFEAKTRASLIAAVLGADPVAMSALVPVTPPALERIVKRCLEKDPEDRYQSMRDVVLDLRSIGAGGSAQETAPSRSRLGMVVGWVVAGVLAIALAILYFRAPNVSAPETRLDIVTPATTAPSSFALSPDGRRIAFVASGDAASRLWVRSLDSTSAQPLPGTEGAANPFWSPDSRSLGFFANSKLKRIDLGGGQPQTLVDVAVAGAQGAWSEEGVILFHQGPDTPLSRVPASGGQVVAVTKLSNGQTGHSVPRFLPGGRQFLFVSTGAGSALWLGSLDGGEPRRIATMTPGTDSAAEYLAPGWLVRVRGNVLVAQRFDAGRGQISGDPVTLAQAVYVDPNTLAGSFSVSPAAGAIAWRSGGEGGRSQLIWFNRTGQNVGTLGGPDEFYTRNPELSPDGKRVAITRGPTGSSDIWIEEGTRASRFTFGQGANYYAIWPPDGARVVFASNRKGVLDLYQKPANGSGSEEVLLQSADNKRPDSWSPDGRFILYYSSLNNGDLMVLPLTGERKPFPFLSRPLNENQGVFSPDGKWVAYQSNESGRNEIYVRPFPGPGGQWQVSTGGGASPRWRADGKELYYLAPDGKLMAVPVAAQGAAQGAALAPGTPEALFQTHAPSFPFRPQYDVARDGRFLIDTEVETTSTEPIHLLLNWKPPAK